MQARWDETEGQSWGRGCEGQCADLVTPEPGGGLHRHWGGDDVARGWTGMGMACSSTQGQLQQPLLQGQSLEDYEHPVPAKAGSGFTKMQTFISWKGMWYQAGSPTHQQNGG